jgi:hypothetical protein
MTFASAKGRFFTTRSNPKGRKIERPKFSAHDELGDAAARRRRVLNCWRIELAESAEEAFAKLRSRSMRTTAAPTMATLSLL